MGTALGLVGIVVFMAAVISLAASVTWVVVKLTPTRDKRDAPKAS